MEEMLNFTYVNHPDAVLEREENHQRDLKIFIANIPKQWSEEQLVGEFSKFGQILEAKIVRKNDESTGSGLIKFATMCRGEYAIKKMRKQTLPGSKNPVQIRWADGEEERLTLDQYSEPKVDVLGLPEELDPKEVERLFREFGEVEAMDYYPKQCRARIYYRYHESVLLATKDLYGKPFPGTERPLQVQMVVDKRIKPSQSYPDKKEIRFFWEINANYNTLRYFYDFQNKRTQYEVPPVDSIILGEGDKFRVQPDIRVQPDSDLKHQKEAPPGASLQVFHLPTSTTSAELEALFRDFGSLNSAYIVTKAGKSMGYGIVSFDNAESAQSALRRVHGLQFQGRRLAVERKRGDGAQQQMLQLPSLRSYDINPL